MDLRSIFSREKAPQSTSLPQVPCIRDMIEDIETCPKNDPVLIFAQILSRKGSRKSSIDSDISEAISASPGPGNFSPGPGNFSRRISNSDADSLPCSPHDMLPGSNFLEIPGGTSAGAGDRELSPTLDATEAIYFKLRQFINISEQTQENTEEVEEKIRIFEQEHKEFLEKLMANKS